MGVTFLDDEPQAPPASSGGGVTFLDDQGQGGDEMSQGVGQPDLSSPLQQTQQTSQPLHPAHMVQPEGSVMSALRTGLYEMLPALGTAGGAVAAGALATPESAGIGTIPAGIAGGAAGGYAGSHFRDWLIDALLGPEWAKKNKEQIEANRAGHPIASGAGGIFPTLVSMAGGGGAVTKLLGIGERAAAQAVEQGLVKAGSAEASQIASDAVKKATEGWGAQAMGIRALESGVGGARLGASQTAQEENPTLQKFADNIAHSAVEFGPLGILPHAETLAKTLGYAVPQAGLTALSDAAYNAVVHGQPMNFQEIREKGLANIIPFALFNAVSHGVGMAQKGLFGAPQAEQSFDPQMDEAGNAFEERRQAINEQLESDQTSPEEKLSLLAKAVGDGHIYVKDLSDPLKETMEKAGVDLNDEDAVANWISGLAEQQRQLNNNQPEDQNALQEPSAGEIFQREPGETGEAGGERLGVEPVEQGPVPAEEGEAPQGENATVDEQVTPVTETQEQLAPVIAENEGTPIAEALKGLAQTIDAKKEQARQQELKLAPEEGQLPFDVAKQPLVNHEVIRQEKPAPRPPELPAEPKPKQAEMVPAQTSEELEAKIKEKQSEENVQAKQVSRQKQDQEHVDALNMYLSRKAKAGELPKIARIQLTPSKNVDPALKNFRKEFESLFNRKVILVRAANPSEKLFHGVMWSPVGDGRTMFINTDSVVHPTAITGHEFMHSLEATHPELHKEFVDALRTNEVIHDDTIKKYGE